jgi:peptidoglycan/xylan/chitin deacetylase (PgdA/CDA1 family)
MNQFWIRKSLRFLLPRLAWPLAAAERAFRGRGTRMLMYHRVADIPGDRLSVHPESFARQMDFLRSGGWQVVPLSSALAAEGAGCRPRVALTFDDGFRDFYSAAWPILRERGFPAAVFVVPGLIEGKISLERYRGRPGEHVPLDWASLGELMRAGVTVGSHGLTHRELTALTEKEAKEEIEESARIIGEKLGTRPAWFAYPRGRNHPLHRRLAESAGYRGAVTVAPGACRPSGDPFALPRTEISADDDPAAFRLKLMGAFDCWHWLWQRTPWF